MPQWNVQDVSHAGDLRVFPTEHVFQRNGTVVQRNERV